MQAAAEATLAPIAEFALDPERSYEIVNGKPEVKEMPGGRHGKIASRIDRRLGTFVETNRLGEVFVETSFQIGENERIPDISFVSLDRIPPEGEPKTKWLIPPDLAIEIVSPNDFYEDVYTKALSYLAAGVKQVWIVSPEAQTITIYRSPTNIIAFPSESELTCEDLLPGFRLPLGEVFKNPARVAD